MPWFSLRSWSRCRRGLYCALALQAALASALALSANRDLLRAELSRARQAHLELLRSDLSQAAPSAPPPRRAAQPGLVAPR